ncbi:MAG: NADH-quinone oxidoreductase subunit L, partial [Planctomycetaceae bacterium]
LVALKQASHAPAAVWNGQGWAYTAIYWVAVITALLTAFYTGRAFFLTFFGPEKLPSPDDPEAEGEAAADAHVAHAHTDAVVSAQGSSHADPGHGHDHGHGHDSHLGHESPPIMIIPLLILAAGAVLVGMIFGPWTHWFEHHLEYTLGFEELARPAYPHGYDWPTIIVGTLVGVLGIMLSGLMYANPSPIPGRLAARLRPLYRASYDKFYVDEFYDLVIIRPLRSLAAVCSFLDERLVHGLVVGTAWVPRIFGREVLAPFQNGLIQFYAAVSALGVAALLWILLLS